MRFQIPTPALPGSGATVGGISAALSAWHNQAPARNYSILWRENITVGTGGQAGVPWVTVQGCGGGVIASAARQSRWGNRFLRDRRGCYGVEIATAQAPRNDNLLNSEQLLPWARVPSLRQGNVRIRIFKIYGLSGLEPFRGGARPILPNACQIANSRKSSEWGFTKAGTYEAIPRAREASRCGDAKEGRPISRPSTKP